MLQTLEITPRQPFVLRVDGTDYNVEYPVTAVAKLEKTLNRGMRSLADWLKITPEELPVVLEAGLDKAAPDKAKEIADAVCASLPAEEIETVIEAICTTTFPKTTERYRNAVEDIRKRAADSLIPNQAPVSSDEVAA